MSAIASEQRRYKPAAPSPACLQRWLVDGRYQYQDDGLYKRCSKCGDYWPADTEFFFAYKGGDGLNYCCRACHADRRLNEGQSTK